MQGCLPAIAGFVLGVVVGAMLGVGLGLAYTKLFNVADFEGYGGMLVFFTFMPLGALAGGLGFLAFGEAPFDITEISLSNTLSTVSQHPLPYVAGTRVVPAALAMVWTMLFSWMVEVLKARSRAMEITAAGIEVAKVRPTLRPR